jgi:type II secretory pathway component PulJ
MKHAFTLLEVVIGTLLSALLATALFNSFWQSNRTLMLVDDYTDFDTTQALLVTQLERDLLGTVFLVEYKEDKKKQKKIMPLEKSFYATNNDNRFELLTFITTNPLLTASGEKPRLVRIIYRLKEDKEHKGSFILTRQESTDLDFDALEKKRPRELVVTHKLVSLSLDFNYTVSSQPEGITEVKTLTQWNSDEQAKSSQERKPLLPAAVHLHATVTDGGYVRNHSFVYTIPVITADYAEQAQALAAPKKNTASAQDQHAAPRGPLGVSQQQFQNEAGKLAEHVKKAQQEGKKPSLSSYVRGSNE